MDFDNDLPKDNKIFDSFIKANKKINDPCYKRIVCSVSGGSDSDVLVDLISKLDLENKTRYIFFDTGLEYEATKQHLEELELKYGITIEWIQAQKPIPTCCKKYGQPFLSKQVSEWIKRLQKHKFQWEDGTFEDLLIKYPKCRAALKWWCNEWPNKKDGSESSYNIAYNRYLKEFIIENPPKFKISNECCHYAKKLVAEKFKINNKIDLSIVGVRKSEGGARATAYKNCFTADVNGTDEYRPIFFYSNETKQVYEQHFNVCHSNCYTKYGLKRTGCAGCPYGKDFEQELEVIKKYEPRLYVAVNNIFGQSYDYTRAYNKFKKKLKADRKEEMQMDIFEYLVS